MGINKYHMEGEIKHNAAFRLIYVTSARYEGDWQSIRHTHYFMELFYVTGGQGHFLVEEEALPLGKGDLVVVNPNVAHTETSLGASPLEYIILGIEGLSLSFEGNKQYLIFNCRNDRQNLMFYFTSLLEEMENKQKGYEAACQDLMELLVLQLMRHADTAFDVVEPQKTNRECSRIKRYIESNYQDDITLDSLAAMAHLNKYYFVHAFSKYYGLSPMNYLREVRIQAGRELLSSTDHSIAEVARLSGFSSQSYFAQTFRKSCGITAGNYRKWIRKEH